jgi:glycosyltransferase involved in cell wall biosynthesis
MHIGYFSSIMGTPGGPAIFDKRVLEAMSRIDGENTYTVYALSRATTDHLQLDNSKENFGIRPVVPSGKWLGISFGLTLELLRRPVDLLHATVIAPPVIPCKFVTTMTCWSQYSQPELYPPFVRWRLLYLLNRAMKNASAIFCYTEYLKDKVIDRFKYDPERVLVVKPGIGEEMKPVEDRDMLGEFLRDAGIDRPYILFLGALTKRKNVDGLIRAYHMLVNETQIEHALVLLGEKGYYFEDIANTIDKLNIRDRVIFVDRHPHEELPLFYSGADVFVFPSHSEGFGLPPLEAMACGTPVVASNSTSVPEVVGDAALLVDQNSVEDIAGAMSAYLTDEKLRKQKIAEGLARAQEFSWERAASQMISAYQRVYEEGW